MIDRLREFLGCARGNIAFMTAGAAFPLLTLAAGGLEFAEYQRHAAWLPAPADTAVLSAFDENRRGWSKRVKRANQFFDINFKHANRVTKVKKRLRGRRDRNRLILSYQAKGKLNSLFGELNPFTNDVVTVRPRAVLHFGIGTGPRLIAPQNASSLSQ